MKKLNLSVVFIGLFFISVGFVILNITTQRIYPPLGTSGIVDPPNSLTALESAPGNGVVVYIIGAGTKVKIECTYGDYYLIETECGKRGFIRKNYIKIKSGAQKVVVRKLPRKRGILCNNTQETSNCKPLKINAGNYSLCALYEVMGWESDNFSKKFDAPARQSYSNLYPFIWQYIKVMRLNTKLFI